ncbi:phage portal protein [Vibrio parahaemolyticus]|uniref:phage portal protein n=1 Tax=Vibrio alfacsensis TaxID=1074311 RepID=UPI002ADDBF8B|nr:phage portal protein [Vibrio alfacsensis]WQE78022.1 phage portal protein [Vibrio alfacsensis]
MTEALIDISKPKAESTYSLDPVAEPIDPNRWLTDYNPLFYNEFNDYWEPPLSRRGLAKISRANAYHGSLLRARANYVTARFVQGGGMRRRQLQGNCHDYFTFGDCAWLKVRDYFGKVIRLDPIPTMFLRRRKNGDFAFLYRGANGQIEQKTLLQKNVIFLAQYDPEQQIYGIADYVGSIQSSLLNKEATLFRRRYYLNGAHMGFIFYATDPNLSKEDEKDLKAAIRSSKGVGNFQSMFVNIPNGAEKGIQLIPVGDIATKDEFERIKNITAQDILVGHRFPPGKGGMLPVPGAASPDPIKVGIEYAKDEIIPVCKLMMDEINSDPEVPKHLHVTFDLGTGQEAA